MRFILRTLRKQDKQKGEKDSIFTNPEGFLVIIDGPLGATVGDFLDKPINHGGLALSRPMASAVIAAFIIGCLLILPQNAGKHPQTPDAAT
jgi:hypothetical protein